MTRCAGGGVFFGAMSAGGDWGETNVAHYWSVG